MEFTTISKSFWHDGEILSWTPEQKYFYLYLITNPRANWCGIFEAPLRLMEAETGYTWETIRRLLSDAEAGGKIVYHEETREIAIVNWLKYHKPDNPNIRKAVKADSEKVKSRNLLHAVKGLGEIIGLEKQPEIANPFGTVTKPLPNPSEGVTKYTNTNTNTNLNKEPLRVLSGSNQPDVEPGRTFVKYPVVEVLSYLNRKAQKNYSATEAHKRFIVARFKEGATLDDFKKVIDVKVSQWATDEKMAAFLRPETLFNATKFQSYLNESPKLSQDEEIDAFIAKRFGGQS